MWVTDALLRSGKATRTPGQHIPASTYEAQELAERMVFSNIRDPWSWYASWYQHSFDRRVPWLKEYGKGLDSFKEVLYGATHPNSVDPRKVGGYWDTPEFDEVAALKAHGTGVFSYVYDYMWANRVQVALATDRLSEAMASFLPGRCSPVPINARGLSYETWFTKEMIEWVDRADLGYIKRFGFEPFTRSPQAVYYFEPRSTLLSRLLKRLHYR